MHVDAAINSICEIDNAIAAMKAVIDGVSDGQYVADEWTMNFLVGQSIMIDNIERHLEKLGQHMEAVRADKS